MMKKIYIIIPAAVVAATIFLLVFKIKKNDINIVSEPVGWSFKKEDSRDRLYSVPVLLYHNIDGRGVYSLDYDTIKSHFSLLKENGIRVIRLSEFIERLERPWKFADKSLVITFDDGYMSMHTKLMPLAKEFAYPVTLFVYTDNVFSRSSRNMTWEHLRELELNGIEIESHSMSHRDLVKIASKNTPASRRELFEEIYLSKRILELYLKKKIRYFSLPYGSYDLDIVDMCVKAGYERVFTTIYGPNIITRNNYCLRRRHIKRDYTLDMIREMAD
jgi:peptidoglycan/xylan/chitin deacetylase (PgdA/CDA1 family)